MKLLVRQVSRKFRGRIRAGEPMSRHTSFGIGGRADIWAEPVDPEDLEYLMDILRRKGIAWTVFGNGTNFLVMDSGIRGAVISMKKFSRIFFNDATVFAGVGVGLGKILKKAAERGLAGMEFCAGIPATAGGALVTNASGRFGEIKDVLRSAVVLSEGKLVRVESEKLGLSYRNSRFPEEKGIIVEVEINLSERPPIEIRHRISEILRYRRAVQPLNRKSAGCVFKNPPRHSAGRLISSLGLGGVSRGDAEISRKHANFIINRGRAKAFDVIELMNLIEELVERSYDIKLERELTIIGD